MSTAEPRQYSTEKCHPHGTGLCPCSALCHLASCPYRLAVPTLGPLETASQGTDSASSPKPDVSRCGQAALGLAEQTRKQVPVSSSPAGGHSYFHALETLSRTALTIRTQSLPGWKTSSAPRETPRRLGHGPRSGCTGKNTGVGCHFLLHGNLPDPGIGPSSLASPGRWILYG